MQGVVKVAPINACFFEPGFNRKINKCPEDKIFSGFFFANMKTKKFKKVMFNMAAIDLNKQIEPINIEHVWPYAPYC